METLLIAPLGIASALDWKYRKVPNWLTFSMITCAFIFFIFTSGLDGLASSIAGGVLGGALLYFPFLHGGTGGGDVKLMAALGAWLGPWPIFQIFLATAVFGGLFSMAELTRHRAGRETLSSLKNQLIYTGLTRKIAPVSQMSSCGRTLHIPYAVSIGCGYLWFYFFGGH